MAQPLEGTAAFIKDLFEVAAAVIVVLGVPVAFYNVTSQWSTRNLSNLTMNEDEMGYFAAGRRSFLWILSFLYIPTVKVPRVPSVGTLICAGDAGIWTSAMLTQKSKSKDPAVSWVPIYEAFFREYAWALDRREIEELGTHRWVREWQRVVGGERMKKYRKEAAFDVWKLKHRVSNSVWNGHTRSRWVWPFSIWREWCIRNILYPIDRYWHSLVLALHAFFYAYQTIHRPLSHLVQQLTAVEIEFDFIPQVERHLLYYPWRIYAKESNLRDSTWCRPDKSEDRGHDCEAGKELPTARSPRDIRPILVSSIRTFEPPDIASFPLMEDGNYQKPKRLMGDEKGQRLRIFNEVPSVKMSEQDGGIMHGIRR